MEYKVYVIQNKNGLLYKGVTQSIEKRLLSHNLGMQRWTKGRGPFKLVYEETYDTKREALIREKFLKSGQEREFLKKLLNVQNFGA